MRPTVRRCLAPLLSTLLFLFPLSSGLAAPLTLAVANSTCTVVKQVGELYRRDHDAELNYICKSSGRLAKGLRGGAIEADIYLSASRGWMDFMIDGGLVAADRVVSPWGNSLVVAVPAGNSLHIGEWEDLASEKVKRLLIGDPSTAPFGRYAKQALENTGLWERVRNKVATRKHITLLAETLANADSATVGILFKTNLNDRLRAVRAVDASWHSPIRYYLAPLGTETPVPEVTALLTFIRSPAARELFRAAGFEVVPR